jgi:hypothetical protein
MESVQRPSKLSRQEIKKLSSEGNAVGFYARVSSDDGGFHWIRMRVENSGPIPIPGASSYMYRAMTKGSRAVMMLGKDLRKAFVQWRILSAKNNRKLRLAELSRAIKQLQNEYNSILAEEE